MRSHNGSIDTTHTSPPLSFYNTFNFMFEVFMKDIVHGKRMLGQG
jgi:hypothetical protein